MDRAARAESDSELSSGSRPRHRYRHVVVDEAQDLSAAHWKMLRAMAPAAPDDYPEPHHRDPATEYRVDGDRG